MIYEYRVYEATPGKMQELVDLMGKAVPFFEKHGMKVVGCWTPAVGEANIRFTYILAFESMAHLEKAWQGFRTDPEWIGVAAEAGKGAPITNAIYNSILEEVPV
jgi:hypothetical protein